MSGPFQQLPCATNLQLHHIATQLHRRGNAHAHAPGTPAPLVAHGLCGLIDRCSCSCSPPPQSSPLSQSSQWSLSAAARGNQLHLPAPPTTTAQQLQQDWQALTSQQARQPTMSDPVLVVPPPSSMPTLDTSTEVVSQTSSIVRPVALAVVTAILLFVAYIRFWASRRQYPRFSSHQSSIKLANPKNGHAGRTLEEVCRASTPPYEPSRVLFNGHLQTIYSGLSPTAAEINYRRWMFQHDYPEYAGSFGVDFVTPTPGIPHPDYPPRTARMSQAEFDAMGSDDSRPMLIILPGIGGGSEETYVRDMVSNLTRNGEWEACAVVSRGCSRTRITTKLFYTASSTWDVAQLVRWLRKRFPNRNLYAMGFSLGANIMTNYIADEGFSCELTAAFAVSNPWDLEAACRDLKNSFFGRMVYLRALGGSIKAIFMSNHEQLKANHNVDWDGLAKAAYLYEFDTAVQVPIWNHTDVWSYYRSCSSSRRLANVRIPLFAVNAMDDPICMAEAMPWETFRESPYVVMATTPNGGHVGWFEKGDERWQTKVGVNFFHAMHDMLKESNDSK